MTEPRTPTRSLKEIAAAIDAHLKRFEADPKLNRYKYPSRHKLSPFWHAGAGASNSWISICYVGYQGVSSLRRKEAEIYLAWLDAGNVGRHFEALRQQRAKGAKP